jgi:phosphonatase-like hydrolase
MSETPRVTLACCGLIGAIITDDGMLERAFAEAIATQGVVPGTGAYARCMAQVHSARGRTSADILRELFPDNEARALAALLAFDRSLIGAVERSGVRPVPGARQVLEGLAGSGVQVSLITSLSRRPLGLLLDALGWSDCINLALGADDVPRGCPAPDLVLAAMLRLGIGDVRDAVVVHGTKSGLECGRRAGASIVAGVLTGTHPAGRLREAGATHVLDSIAELPGVLENCGSSEASTDRAARRPADGPERTSPRRAPSEARYR